MTSGRPAPEVSVVMPVHNEERFLSDSIRSILSQTHRDFEFVILDDASTDATPEMLRDWAGRDDRIRVISSPERLGLVGASNAVVRAARAAFCARMDADDVAHPDRLRRQVEVIRGDDGVVLVGTLWHGLDASGRLVRPRDRWRLVRRSPFAPFPHGSVMYRRDVFWSLGGYREPCVFWEDLDLYFRMARRGRVMVVPSNLYGYRFHTGCVRLVSAEERVGRAVELAYACAALRRAGRDYDPLLEPESERARSSRDGRRGASAAALVSLGSSRLWAGHRPFGWRELLRLSSWEDGRVVLQACVLGILGAASPAALRGALRALIRLRDWLAGRVLRGEVVEWRCE